MRGVILSPLKTQRARFAAALVAYALLVCHSSRAQQAKPLTLSEILQQMESNLRRYRAEVPSFLCDEHLVSKENQYLAGQGHLDTEADSVFRLKRGFNADGTTTLTESRDVKAINRHPANGEDVNGPSRLEGAFSGGLSAILLNEAACIHYTFRQMESGSAPRAYVVGFSSLPASERPIGCSLEDGASGKVFIDPASMQITRMEMKVPRHGIFPMTADGQSMPALLGSWELSIVYAPVMLDGRVYWMPANISSITMTKSFDWTFKTTYRNYHKLEVTSRILPPSAAPAP